MVLRVADLFCGAGGTSTGLAKAAEEAGRKVELLAVNHWEVAVATHAANHDWARHINAPLEGIEPRKAIGAKKLDVLVASPECTHHSTARGGRPVNDQSRASAWHVLTWAQSVEPEWIIVENVPEFRSWGPIGRDGRPLVSRKGETFRAWVAAIESLGYRVDSRILNAADYGDPTTRRRLFVIARRGRRAPVWPEPSHRDPKLGADLYSRAAPWRTAREAVIDWDLRGTSIFGRKKPLAEATLRRIAEGIRRFGGAEAGAFLDFLVPFYGERRGQAPRTHSVDSPVPTIPTDPKFGLAHLVQYHGSAGPRSVEEPLPTATTRDRFGLVEPFVITPGGANLPGGRPVSSPLPTVTCSDRFALVEPFMLSQQSGGAPRPVSSPVPTLATDGAVSLIEPRPIDILFRMLQPHELAAAMSFPKDYKFTGNRGDVMKQIGNAVPVGVATALCRTAIGAIGGAA
jgi:DNA (cytosine-5)-methyltransferase 1